MEQRRPWTLVYVVCSFLLALLWKPDAWRYFRDDFVGKDTIFNLAREQQFGLVVVTTFLIVFLLWLNLYKSRYIGRYVTELRTDSSYRHTAPLVDVALTIILFIVAIAIVPQILYLFYRLLFAELPWQWVASLPTYLQLQKFVLLNPADSLNTVISGLTFWSMIAGVLLFWIYRYTDILDVVGRVIAGIAVSARSVPVCSLPFKQGVNRQKYKACKCRQNDIVDQANGR